ncbi:hypothetical protein Goshw_005663 [Gossypium schwendimanii]|uniref:Zinc knuckle CX2CX4HX4C domain-containing protein n=1 Tax=Gossypium schwendimanii TaxID=34291 RepID=A0A7J9NF03_GOSSC|nr:hypothetical protein [Gossypium schwendimanii]
MYKRQVLQEIRETIGKVAKLDFNTDNGIEYEHLPTACFQCGHYEHIKEIRSKGEMGLEGIGKGTLGDKMKPRHTSRENTGESPNLGVYGPWMLVERKARKTGRVGQKDDGEVTIGTERNSRF